MNSLAGMALVMYCMVLSFAPLCNMHIEGLLLPDVTFLADHEYYETDVMVLIHQVLFAYLCNNLEHIYRSMDRIAEPYSGHIRERLLFDSMALKPYLISLALFVYVHCVIRIYNVRSSLAALQTLFCYRRHYHSPPFLYSL